MGVWNFTLVLVLLLAIIMVAVQAKDKGIFFLEARQGGMEEGNVTTPDTPQVAFVKCASMNWAASIGQPCFSRDELMEEGLKIFNSLSNTKQSQDQALGSVRTLYGKSCAEREARCGESKTCVCKSTCFYKPDSSKDCKKEFTAYFPALVKMAKEQSSGTVFGPQFEPMILTTFLAVLFAHIY